eukprot:jgi/Antlo1/1586/738
MFMDLRNETNHLLYLYFNSIGIMQRDYGNEDILEQVDTMCKEIRSCQKRIHEILDRIVCENTENTVCEPQDSRVLQDGIEFMNWIVSRGLEAHDIRENSEET